MNLSHLNLTRIFAYLAGLLPTLQLLLPHVIPAPYGTIAGGVIGIALTAGHQLNDLLGGPAPAAGTKTSAPAAAAGA